MKQLVIAIHRNTVYDWEVESLAELVDDSIDFTEFGEPEAKDWWDDDEVPQEVANILAAGKRVLEVSRLNDGTSEYYPAGEYDVEERAKWVLHDEYERVFVINTMADAAHIASTYRDKCWSEVFRKIVESFWFAEQLPNYKNIKITVE